MGNHVPMSTAPTTLPPIEQAVAAVLRAERAAARVELAQIAEATGIGKRSLIRYLAGQRAMSVGQISDIASAIGLDFATVYRRAEERLSDEQG
jgi:transcriptional regulator with XRE-family HTH domain